ncbi:transcription factor bHLH131-like [Cucurbita maxima]|uniref:Transcription factor bHLH131-like n=1 Tax=Cucurbita maxima TaxID=3661 RepID=A0A6J1KTG6_CUCMA|nr:transcription factor bHLH131-like [Cucurbita maxima]
MYEKRSSLSITAIIFPSRKVQLKGEPCYPMVLLHQVMQSIQSYPTSGTMERIYPQWQPPTIKNYSPISSLPRKEPKLYAAQKHRLAEQNRRNRISGQYATLRAILPSLSKTDKRKHKKAFVLAETIRRVKELKKLVSEKTAANRGVKECGIPSGANRLSLENCDGVEGMVKAVMSCEDRQDIMAELGKALKTVKMKVVRAEMVTVGGRNKFVLWMQGPKEGPAAGGVKRALDAVMRKSSWIARKPRTDWHTRLPTPNRYGY